MKRYFLFTSLIAVLFLISQSLFFRDSFAAEHNLILTDGVAEITGQNDSLKISMEVVTAGKKLEKVSSENSLKMRAVIDSVKGLDIHDLNIKTSGYRILPQRDYKVRPSEIIGYEAHHTVEIKLEGFDSVHLSDYASRIIEKGLEKGANSIQYIQSYIKDETPLENRALGLAVDEARNRAEILARAAGVTIKRIVTISTEPIVLQPRQDMLRSVSMKDESSQVSPPIEIGESQVRVHVRMAFEIE